MDTWDAITSRRQVRSFTDQPVPDTDLESILEAGRRAPSARNGQPWDFVVVRERDQMRQLSDCWAGASWIAGAPVTIACVLDDADNDRSRMLHRFDLGQAAMQMMITAAALGVGSGQAACEDQELAADVLGFPEGHHCALLIALGYPGDRPLRPIRKPARREFADVVHYDTW